MPLMRVVAARLKKRVHPVDDVSDDRNVVGKVFAGHEFESVLQQTNASGIWHQDRDGYWYWGGGLEQAESSEEVPVGTIWSFDKERMSWAHDSIANNGLGIVDLWNESNTRGKRIRVAVIDSGAAFSENDLHDRINLGESDGFDAGDISDGGSFHGTRSAGVIAADGAHVNSAIGVAPDCELIIYKLYSDEALGGYTDGNLAYFLSRAIDSGVDIISMSFTRESCSPEVEEQLKKCAEKGILMVCAVGDVRQSDGIQNRFPASFDSCISVGAYCIEYGQRALYDERSSQSDHLFCLGPGKNILTAGETSAAAMHQDTSAAAPFVAGIFALVLSYRKKRGLPLPGVDEFKNALRLSCDRINTNSSWDPMEGYGIINPMKLFNRLKNL